MANPDFNNQPSGDASVPRIALTNDMSQWSDEMLAVVCAFISSAVRNGVPAPAVLSGVNSLFCVDLPSMPQCYIDHFREHLTQSAEKPQGLIDAVFCQIEKELGLITRYGAIFALHGYRQPLALGLPEGQKNLTDNAVLPDASNREKLPASEPKADMRRAASMIESAFRGREGK